MASKGNGVAKTNELLVQILGELGAIRKEQIELRKTVEGQGQTLREHGQTLKRVEGEIHDMKMDMRQLNSSLAQIARFVGEDRARQDHEIQDIRVRVEALERRAA